MQGGRGNHPDAERNAGLLAIFDGTKRHEAATRTHLNAGSTLSRGV
jgi:hypothetical protein